MTGLLFLFTSLFLGFVIEEKAKLTDDSLWEKLAFAVIVGFFFSTWLIFLLSLVFGFNNVSVFSSLFILFVFIVYAWPTDTKPSLWIWGIFSSDKKIPLTLWFLLLFIMPFFIFGVWETDSGDWMFLGNYTDLSYHMSIISAFLEQPGFPPENPQCAGAKMSYHFLVNFHSAILHFGGFSLLAAVIIPQILFAFALATMLYYFYRTLLESEISTFFSATLFIMGHIAFFNILSALAGHPVSHINFDITSWHSIKEHMLFPYYNFLNPVINYFHPQRPFLFAFPLSLIVLSSLYKVVLKRDSDSKILFFLSMIIGLMPLFHAHTFLILAPIIVLSALYLRFDFKKTVLVLLPLGLALGQIWFILSQPKTPGFSGFDVHKLGGGLTDVMIFNSEILARVLFWIRTTGFSFLLGLAGFWAYYRRNRLFSIVSREGRKNSVLLIYFFVPFCFFVLINFYRFSPNWGDSNKFFLYLNLILSFFAGNLLGRWFKKNWACKVASLVLVLVAAIIPSTIEAYGIFTRSGSPFFSGCDRHVADWIRYNTPEDAIFLTADTTIHFLPPLSGRRVVDGSYTSNTGFKKPGTENDVRKIYKTGDSSLIKKYNITHVLLGPHEKRRYVTEEKAFQQYRLIYDQTCCGETYQIFNAREKGVYRKPEKNLRQPETPNRNEVYLSDIVPVKVTQSIGQLQLDANFNHEPIILNGKNYEKGIGTHAYSEIIYEVNGRYHFFESDAGLDDTEDRSPGSVVFKVYADGVLKHESPVLRWDSETHHIQVDVRNAGELKLIVEDGGDKDTCDHASWAGAVLY